MYLAFRKQSFLILLFLLGSIALPVYSDEAEPKLSTMTGDRLVNTIIQLSDDPSVNGNIVRFVFNQSLMFCVFDERANRMRIVSPIAKAEEFETEHFMQALEANYHSALDVRYAISEGVIYAAFLHPLSSLHEYDLQSALWQLSNAQKTFGTAYTGGSFVFPGGENDAKQAEKKKESKL
jgi:hypothetical protein